MIWGLAGPAGRGSMWGEKAGGWGPMVLVTCHCTIVCKVKHVCRVFFGIVKGSVYGVVLVRGLGDFEVQGHQCEQKEVPYQLAFSCLNG